MKKISLESVCFQYKKNPIIKDLSLELKGHTCTALMGANGSGKTTLGKLIMGILKPKTGHVFYDDMNIESKSLGELGSRVGYLFQNPSQQIFAVTVRDDLTFSSRLNGLKEELIEAKLNKVVSLFHLETILDSNCHVLSQGEKQRVALASIFIRDPEYLILDEPTTGLDSIRKEALGQVIQSIKKEGVGVLIISHDKKFVHNHADEVIEMEAI